MDQYNITTCIMEINNFNNNYNNSNRNSTRPLKKYKIDKWCKTINKYYDDTLDRITNLENKEKEQDNKIKEQDNKIKEQNNKIDILLRKLEIKDLKILYNHLKIIISDIDNIFIPKNKCANNIIETIKIERNIDCHILNKKRINKNKLEELNKLIGCLYRLKNSNFNKLLNLKECEKTTNKILNQINNSELINIIKTKIQNFDNIVLHPTVEYEDEYGYLYDVLEDNI